MDNPQHQNSTLGMPGDDEALQALFRHADARQRPPAEAEVEIRSALHEHWRGRVRTGRRRRATLALGLAASLAAAVLIGQQLLQPPTLVPAVSVATLVKHTGQVRIRTGGDNKQVHGEHAPGSLFAGHELQTEESSAVALSWAGGESIRLGEKSRVRLCIAGLQGGHDNLQQRQQPQLLEHRLYIRVDVGDKA